MILFLALLRPDLIGNLAAWQTESVDNPVTWLANLGTAGVWLICTITGVVPSKGEVRILQAQLTRAEEQIDRHAQLIEALRDQMTTRTVPTLARVAEVVADREPDRVDRLEQLFARIEKRLPDEGA